MAHVLLPCDLCFWPEVRRHLSRTRECRDGHELAHIMTQIYSTCWVSLDPEEQSNHAQPHLFQELANFLTNELSDDERSRFFDKTLPDLATTASKLSELKPPSGFLYSLRQEEKSFRLERGLVACLLANAFFSTFPRRNAKTHPTLQDFSFAHFFPHLHKRNHQKKLRAFFRYFEKLEERSGFVHFTRKGLRGPSLPGWLCSDRPLLPVIVQAEEEQLMQPMLQVCSCDPLIGGDVLRASSSKESRLFFNFPELLVILSFVESLSEAEVLVAENIDQYPLEAHGLNFCFSDFTSSSSRQFEDQFLLKELNKALSAFRQEQAPSSTWNTSTSEAKNSDKLFCVGGSSSSLSKDLPLADGGSKRSSLTRSSLDMCQDPPLRDWKTCRRFSNDETRRQQNSDTEKKLARKESSNYTKLANSKSTSCSSGRSMQTAASPKEEERYFTADDDSEEGGCDDVLCSSSRSESVGFVLGEHERLEDFRKRIRKRTRRRLYRRRSSSSSYLSSSSDMEDISEEENPEEVRYMRVATSEPSLVTAMEEENAPLCQAAEALLLRGRKMMVTSSDGRLKAYSYDGVNPNLPVPFKAKFRKRCCRRQGSSTESMAERRVVVFPCEERMDQLKIVILWLAASMAEAEFCIVPPFPGDPLTAQIPRVYSKVVSRGWSIGDLSCEVLRFCRNRLSTRGMTDDLFGQLMGVGDDTLRQPSLD